jgi:predicted amidophosphoribosyltransferase
MPQTVVEKAICDNCGADVREGTAFCYNCGVPVADVLPPDSDTSAEDGSIAESDVADAKTQAALDELAEKLKFDQEEDKKLAKAAAERRKARVSQRKRSKEFTWESSDESPGGLLLLITALIAIFAVIVVLFTVLWK